jgi:hypothetical protein
MSKKFSLVLISTLLVLTFISATSLLQAAETPEPPAPGVLVPETFAVLAKKISAAVVNISTEKL